MTQPKEAVVKPRLTLSVKELPDIKNWRVGGKYSIALQVEEVAVEKNQFGDSSQPMAATFRIISARSFGKGERVPRYTTK